MQTSITATGTLFDKVMGRPIRSSFIEFLSGEQRVQAETESDGSFQVGLHSGGKWTIAPSSAPEGDTIYAFAPLDVEVSGDGDLGQVEVEGDQQSNALTLANYVRNAFLACSKIFEEEVAKVSAKHPNDLTEAQVKLAAAEVFAIATAGLKNVVADVPLPVTEVGLETNIACSVCYSKYANDPVKLQQCLCCPTPCF